MPTFFPSSLHRKLELILQDIPALPLPEIFGRDTLQEPMRSCLEKFQQALVKQQPICLTYLDRYDLYAQPFRLEYHAQKHYFSYIVYEELRGFQRINATAIKEIVFLSGPPIGNNLSEKFQKFLNQHKTSLTLALSPKWNAVERCFLLFSSYEKEAVYEEDTDRYQLMLYFYDFDTEDVLNDIISLGSAVTLISPENLRQRIIKRLLAAYQWYQKEE